MKRSFVVDLFKLLAAQAIVLHHLSAYGPMGDVLHEAWPVWSNEFFNLSRLAVQVFLVMGGFLAAQSIRLDAHDAWRTPVWQLIGRRYLRLIPPYLTALCLISLLVWCMRPHISGDWLVESPTWSSAFAHVLTLQGVLDMPALSAGVWYVAMDFQLYVLLVLMAAAFRTPRATAWAVALLCLASMWYFNHHAALDNWALYFFGAYGLGVLAAWVRRSVFHQHLFSATAWLALGALWVVPRIRLGVALATGLLLTLGARWQTPRNRVGELMQRLADSSYGMFLTHYGIIVVVSAVFEIEHLSGLPWAIGFLLLAWVLSVATGMAFHRWVEQPLGKRLNGWLRERASRHSATHTGPTELPWPPTTHTPQTSPRLR